MRIKANRVRVVVDLYMGVVVVAVAACGWALKMRAKGRDCRLRAAAEVTFATPSNAHIHQRLVAIVLLLHVNKRTRTCVPWLT